MKRETINKANKLVDEISRISHFLRTCECNWYTSIFKKKRVLGAKVNDYMRESKYFELNSYEREEFIKILQNELDMKKKELEELEDDE